MEPVVDNKPMEQLGSGKRPFFQAKLTVNKPGDGCEQEADAIADQVMRMRAPVNDRGVPFKKVPIASLQRKCGTCEEKKLLRKEIVQREEDNTEQVASESPVPMPDLTNFRLRPLSLLSPPDLPSSRFDLGVSPPSLGSGPTNTRAMWNTWSDPVLVDWQAINQMLLSRGALHLRGSLVAGVEQQAAIAYSFFRSAGLPHNLSVSAVNASLPTAVGSSLARDIPTPMESIDRQIPGFRTPILPVFGGTFDKGISRSSGKLFGLLPLWRNGEEGSRR